MRAGGVEVHGGLCHLAIGAALEEEVVCHLFVGCKVGGEVPHQDTTIWSLLDLHLCASKGRVHKTSYITLHCGTYLPTKVIETTPLLRDCSRMPQFSYRHSMSLYHSMLPTVRKEKCNSMSLYMS